MPATRDPIILQVRGPAAYRRALESLAARLGCGSLSELTDRALRGLAARHGAELPERARPVGTNRYTIDEHKTAQAELREAICKTAERLRSA